MLTNVCEYLKKSSQICPEKAAIVYQGRKTNYKELYEYTEKVASWIIKNINTTKRPIIVMMKNSEKAIASFLGVALSRNIYVPLDWNLPLERLKVIVSILDPVAVINCEESKISSCVSCPVISWDEILKENAEKKVIISSLKSIIDTDPLYILFTSGSTGIPKGVVVSHRAVIDFTEEATEAMRFSHDEIFLNQAPFYFDASVPDIFCTIKNGATLHIVDKQLFSYPIKLMEYISEHQINALYWVPSALIIVANLKVLEKRDISCLKKIMFCGEVMPIKQLNMWMRAVPEAMFVNYYGPSEATYACSYYIVDRIFNNEESLPIGKAAQNSELIIIADGKEVKESGVIGELYIRGSGLALGYYHDDKRTEESFFQNPIMTDYPEIVYKTGDLAHYDQEGNIIYDGRSDNQIKHMGYRIELGEIENTANSFEEISQAVCIYKKEQDSIICFYVGEQNADKLLEVLKNKLPFYMIPKRIIQIEKFPMNSNGKIDRKELFKLL